MTASRDPDRLIHAFLLEGEDELHDQVYDAVRAEIEQKRQRGFIGPWRTPTMNRFLSFGLGAAAVVVIVLLVGSRLFGPNVGSGGEATPTPLPSVAEPTPSPASPPPLTQSFTSTQHGISMSYPEGWTAKAATEPWTGGGNLVDEPYRDFLYDEIMNLYLSMASQPIGDATPEEWMAARMASNGCSPAEPIEIDGAAGLIGPEECGEDVAAVTIGGRGYEILLLTSDDDPAAVALYDRAWFEEVLATVQLHPEDAVD